MISDPVQRALVEDLGCTRLLAAADDGRYGIHAFNFPIVLAWVAVDGGRLGLRLDCVGYPTQAPAGQPWDLAGNVALPVDRWPTGTRAGRVFRRDWSPTNGNAPYLACDRVPLQTHPDWQRVMAERAWNPTRDLAFYLEQVYGALQEVPKP
jgi:hypothetical protein